MLLFLFVEGSFWETKGGFSELAEPDAWIMLELFAIGFVLTTDGFAWVEEAAVEDFDVIVDVLGEGVELEDRTDDGVGVEEVVVIFLCNTKFA